MRVLVLNGSPHRMKGSTGQLTGALVSGIVEAGGDVDIMCAYDLEASACLGCFTCWTRTPGRCTQRDDMDDVVAAVRRSDILVLATPVYCDGMTGRLKTLMDRMLPLMHGAAEIRDGHMRHHPRDDTKVRTMVLVSTCGFVEQDNFDPLIHHAKALAKNLACDFGGALTVPGGLKTDRVEQIGKAAREAGIELARTRAIPDHLQEAMHGHSVSRSEAVEGLNRHFGADRPETAT
ncbi:MAG: flavodoxin family protein [Bacillota bacterium]|nr:flavodoxin family protein [Bacillota bacterium]